MYHKHLILDTHKKPTLLNKEAAIGSFVVPGLGTVIGSLIGYQRTKHEYEEGKPVYEPSLMNRDTLLGGAMGNLVGIAAAAMVAAVATVATSGAVLLPAALTWAASVAVGAAFGGYNGKESMKQDYARAEAQEAARNQALTSGLGMQAQNLGISESNYTQKLDEERARMQQAGYQIH